jgi:F-type H+-transporting ATPase subunit c
MRKTLMLILAALATMMFAVTAFAQPANEAAGGASATGYKYIAAGIGFAIAVFGGAIGQSRVAAAACEGAARNPGASGKIQVMMILGLALIESLVLFALLVVFAGLKP